jgi:hypothetical protein
MRWTMSRALRCLPWLPASISCGAAGGDARRPAGGHKATTEASGATATGVCVRSTSCDAPTRAFLQREGMAARGPRPRRSCGCFGGPRREKATIRRHQVSPLTRALVFNCIICAKTKIWGFRLGLGFRTSCKKIGDFPI